MMFNFRSGVLIVKMVHPVHLADLDPKVHREDQDRLDLQPKEGCEVQQDHGVKLGLLGHLDRLVSTCCNSDNYAGKKFYYFNFLIFQEFRLRTQRIIGTTRSSNHEGTTKRATRTERSTWIAR